MNNRVPSFTNFDRSYRKGVVLGVSLAEVFIILIFLLLMAMIGYAVSKDEELETVETKLEMAVRSLADAEPVASDLRDQLAVVRVTSDLPGRENPESQDPIDVKEFQPGNPIDNDDPNLLINGLNKKIDDLTKSGSVLRDKLAATASDVNDLYKKVDDLTKSEAGLRDKLAATASDAKIGKQVQEVAVELRLDLKDLLAAVSAQKGQDSPCWYRMAKRNNGEDYEKAFYIFDVKISDRFIFVGDIPAPTAEYEAQKIKLQYDRTALNRNLYYKEFIPSFQSLKSAGENREIRYDRRCKFYVRVWDSTSDSNKYGFKRAFLNIVQNVFLTYEVQSDEWTH